MRFSGAWRSGYRIRLRSEGSRVRPPSRLFFFVYLLLFFFWLFVTIRGLPVPDNRFMVAHDSQIDLLKLVVRRCACHNPCFTSSPTLQRALRSEVRDPFTRTKAKRRARLSKKRWQTSSSIPHSRGCAAVARMSRSGRSSVARLPFFLFFLNSKRSKRERPCKTNGCEQARARQETERGSKCPVKKHSAAASMQSSAESTKCTACAAQQAQVGGSP